MPGADEPKPAGLRPSTELKEIQEYNFADPKLNIKILNSAVSFPPRYGRAELTLVRISKKLEAAKGLTEEEREERHLELTEEEEKWMVGVDRKVGSDGKIDTSKSLMRAVLDKHYDLIFWKSSNARRLNAELVRNASKPQYNITVQDAGKGVTAVRLIEEQASPEPGGSQQK